MEVRSRRTKEEEEDGQEDPQAMHAKYHLLLPLLPFLPTNANSKLARATCLDLLLCN